MTQKETEFEQLKRVAQGDSKLLGTILLSHQERLNRMVKYRLDHRLQGRVDCCDIIQESFLEAAQRLEEFLKNPDVPFFVWLRFLVGQQLTLVHRRHLGVKARDAGKEVSLYKGALPGASSAALAAQLIGNLTSPSLAATKAEMKLRLQEALNGMHEIDREVLVLRHFEHLTNSEAAKSLGIQESASTNRYVRALDKLGIILKAMSGGVQEI